MHDQMECLEIWGGNYAVEEYFRRPGLDVWIYSRPHNDAANGGDIYYLSSCASGHISRMLLADVSGHGQRVSKVALRLRDLMRRHVNTTSQARFIRGMNEEFVACNQEGSFATAIVGTFYSSDRSFQLCVAGHPRPLLYRQQTGQWEVFEPTRDPKQPAAFRNAPLGVMEGVEYDQSQLNLKPGDMLLAYTDGVTETRVAHDELLNTPGLLNLVQSLDAARPEVLLKSLLEALNQQATAPMGDDVSLFLARATGSKVQWRSTLLAPFRFLRRVRDKTRMR